jgi:hypothetical protein
LGLQVEHFGQDGERVVGVRTAGAFEEGRHLGLPAGVDVAVGHAGAGGVEVLGLQVADEESVLGEEQRVVRPAGFLEGLEHLGPDGGVAFAVLVHAVGPDAEGEAHARLGRRLQAVGRGCQGGSSS